MAPDCPKPPQPVVPTPAVDSAAPTATAATLEKIVQDLLNVQVGRQDRFVDFTDSMSALEYVNRVSEHFHVEIPVTAMFGAAPDIESLARLIEHEQSVLHQQAPTSPATTEATLVEILNGVIDSGAVGTRDRFIDFTDSISALEYVNRIRDTFGVDISPTDLYNRAPDVASLARLLDEFGSHSQAVDAVAVAAPRPEAHVPNPMALPLPGGEWSVWKTVALRGAGFPASVVKKLAGPGCAQAADAYIAASDAVPLRQAEALAALRRSLRQQNEPSASSALRRRLRNASRGVANAVEPLLEETAFRYAIEQREVALSGLRNAFEQNQATLATVLADIVEDPRFREAVLWQNRAAIPNALEPKRLERPTSASRRNAEFIAMLVQRYATKNDSIGFFGPIGWASMRDESFIVEGRPGATLLSNREVYFEGWAIDSLARRLEQRWPAIRRWCPPRLRGGVWLGANDVFVPIAGAIAVSPLQRWVLEKCDGATSAEEIVAMAGAASASEAEILAALDQLVDAKLLIWQLEVSPQLYPEVELAGRLSRIGDSELKRKCEDDLHSLLDARAAVAGAAGAVSKLELALQGLDATFTAVTDEAPSRRAGQMYAARGVVFEDCRRDYQLSFGTGFLESLGPPLSVVLDGARWVSTELRRGFTRQLRVALSQMRSALKRDVIDAHLFMNYVGDHGRELLAPVSQETLTRFQQLWQRLMPADTAGRRIVLDMDTVRRQAQALFASSGPSSWCGYFAPDVMIASPSLEAFRSGEFQCVLGEVHSNNTLLWSALRSQHPDAALLEAALSHDTSGRDVMVMQTPKTRWVSRLNPLTLPAFWRYEFGDDLPSHPPCRSLPAGMLNVSDDGDKVCVTARSGDLSFDAYELFAVTMSYEADRIVAGAFRSGSHSPRVTLGNLTLGREQWRMTPSEMPFLALLDRPLMFAGARAWAAAHGLPRHVFYKSPGETKPCYLDFNSPLYVGVFAKLMRKLRQSAQVVIVEMLPTLDETWLSDIDDERFTSEIRIAARRVD